MLVRDTEARGAAQEASPKDLEAAAADALGRLVAAMRAAEACGDHDCVYGLMTTFWRQACPAWERCRAQMTPPQHGISFQGRIDPVPPAVQIALLDGMVLAGLMIGIHGMMRGSDIDATIRDWLWWAITNDEPGEDWHANYHRYVASFAETTA